LTLQSLSCPNKIFAAMPLNFQQILAQVKQIGMEIPSRQARLEGLQQQAGSLFKAWSQKNTELKEKVTAACQFDPDLRCALPLKENLDAAIPVPKQAASVTLLAADGSQILPDRHATFHYSLVNVGAIIMQPGSGNTPQVYTKSSLLYADDLYTDRGLLGSQAIEMSRDIAERRMLLELSGDCPPPLVALTDGPVELWGRRNGGEDDYRRNLEIHLGILSQMQARDLIVAGYVDKPAADLVVRSLEIAMLSREEEYKTIRTSHRLRGVTDLWLYGFLPPGHRSAVFGLQSSAVRYYAGSLALHFFYLNVGSPGHPALARVEFPAWVAQDPGKVDILQASLLEQCRVMGFQPYPYILVRAHEIAVVKFEDRERVEQMLGLEIRRFGGKTGGISPKQSAKDQLGKGKK
jgi:hypothetical protein